MRSEVVASEGARHGWAAADRREASPHASHAMACGVGPCCGRRRDHMPRLERGMAVLQLRPSCPLGNAVPHRTLVSTVNRLHTVRERFAPRGCCREMQCSEVCESYNDGKNRRTGNAAAFVRAMLYRASGRGFRPPQPECRNVDPRRVLVQRARTRPAARKCPPRKAASSPGQRGRMDDRRARVSCRVSVSLADAG